MDYSNIVSMLKESRYTEYGRHDLLISMSCVYEYHESLEEVDLETDFEIIFAVPIDWLVALKNEESKDYLWGQGDVRGWLQEKYTSEDSQAILEKAVLEHKVAFWKINQEEEFYERHRYNHLLQKNEANGA